MTTTATYSPEDNKCRVYPSERLDAETYAKVKAAGYRWAPKQELFFAVWSPKAEDMAIELAGEIGDEDKTLAERAEERAERFEGYSEKRGNEADRARAAVEEISGRFEGGQPIICGHHSEQRARRDAQKIENGMRKAVGLWETSKYWTNRAAGAIHAAKYKELPAVRARRIKTIEADLRRELKTQKQAREALEMYTNEKLTLKQAQFMSGYSFNGLSVERQKDGSGWWSAWDVLRPDGERYAACPAYTLEQVQEKARIAFPRAIERAQRWINHYENRLAYEKAMLEEQGGSALIAKKPRPTQLPLLNYRAPEGITVACRWSKAEHRDQVEMTKAEYSALYEGYKGTDEVDGTHRVRAAIVNHKHVCVFITDSKTHDTPAPNNTEAAPVVQTFAEPVAPWHDNRAPVDHRAKAFEALKEQAEQGVRVVSAPQLFVTPKELAERMVEAADIQPGQRVLEPSAGTGNLIRAAIGRATGADLIKMVAVEVNHDLAQGLEEQRNKTVYANETNFDVRCADFLQCNGDLGKFDRIIMNPPFAGQADIEHVTHALKFLNPGGKLVAIMSAGVEFRQDRKAFEFRKTIEELGGTIEALPADSFKESGTSVNTVLVEVSL